MPFDQIEDHTFFTQFLGPESVVLDLGANRGAFSREMIARFGARCIAIEANPQLAHAIPPDPRLTVLNLAVGPESGVLPFFIAAHDERSSLSRMVAGENAEVLPVRVVRLGQLLTDLRFPRVDLIKFDIEGLEVEVLNSCPDDLLQSIPQLTVEFHDFNGMVPRKAIERTVERLLHLGFMMTRMWMRSYGDTLFLNRNQVTVDWLDRVRSRLVQRNWWWFQRFVRRKLGRAR